MYSGIKSSRNGYSSIAYPMTDKKFQIEERIGAFRCGGGIIDTGNIQGIRKQFARIWKRGGREIGAIQAYNILYSFSEKELDPAEPDSLEQAADIVAPAIEKIYPGHQWALVVQKDGKGGKVHVHVTVNALHSETLKACRGRQTSYLVIREEIEKQMEKAGIEIDCGKDHTKSEAKKRAVAKKKKAAGYSWADDLTQRIRAALSRTTRFAELESNLEAEGVEVTRKTKSNWTFPLKKAKDKKYDNKKSRGDKLAADLVPKEMRRTVDENYQKMVAAAAAQKAAQEAIEERQKRIQIVEELEKRVSGYSPEIEVDNDFEMRW